MKTQYKYLVLIFLAIFAVNTLNAQVTVGADEEPAVYSMLQVESADGRTGIRMPQLSKNQITALQEKIEQTSEKKEKAKGLMVYNTEDKQLQYWNGNKWIALKQYAPVTTVTGSNGLTVEGGGTDVQLGGALSENTTIDLKDKTLSFPSAGGKFDIQGSAFMVTDGKVGIGTNAPTSDLHIKSTVPGKAFRMTEVGVPSSDKHVMMSDGTGNAYWTKPPAYSKIVSGTISNNTTIAIFTPTFKTPSAISNTIILTEGKWIIMARVAITSTQSTGYCSWLYLMEDGAEKSVIIAAHAKDGAANNYMATPELAVSVEVGTGNTKQYELKAGYDRFSGASSAIIRTDLGGGSFIAVKIGN